MAQTKDGALKIAARKAGVTVEQYLASCEAGQKWCVLCRLWHPTKDFAKDSSRWDGHVPSCRKAKNELARLGYVPKDRPDPGRSFVPARDGDRKQARRRINYFVEARLLSHPNIRPCTDCGHVWRPGERRHEYDHHLGYTVEHHEHIQPVCTKCHRKRAIAWGEWGTKRK